MLSLVLAIFVVSQALCGIPQSDSQYSLCDEGSGGTYTLLEPTQEDDLCSQPSQMSISSSFAGDRRFRSWKVKRPFSGSRRSFSVIDQNGGGAQRSSSTPTLVSAKKSIEFSFQDGRALARYNGWDRVHNGGSMQFDLFYVVSDLVVRGARFYIADDCPYTIEYRFYVESAGPQTGDASFWSVRKPLCNFLADMVLQGTPQEGVELTSSSFSFEFACHIIKNILPGAFRKFGLVRFDTFGKECAPLLEEDFSAMFVHDFDKYHTAEKSGGGAQACTRLWSIESGINVPLEPTDVLLVVEDKLIKGWVAPIVMSAVKENEINQVSLLYKNLKEMYTRITPSSEAIKKIVEGDVTISQDSAQKYLCAHAGTIKRNVKDRVRDEESAWRSEQSTFSFKLRQKDMDAERALKDEQEGIRDKLQRITEGVGSIEFDYSDAKVKALLRA